MKSRAFGDWSWKLATVIAILGLATPIVAEDFRWQGTIGQGLEASIIIPGATELPTVVMQARSPEQVKAVAAIPGAHESLSWVVDLRLVSQNKDRTFQELQPDKILSQDKAVECTIDFSSMPNFRLKDLYIGYESKVQEKKVTTWVNVKKLLGNTSYMGIRLKSDPVLKGHRLTLEFLEWPAEDPMIGGT